MNASAWIETKRSACTRRAFLTRSCSGTKKSASRVSIARMPGMALTRSRSIKAIARTTSFSCSPLGPLAPGSSPPWPGSIATTTRRSIFACARCGGSAAPGPRGLGSGSGMRAPPATVAPGADAAPTLPMNSPSASCTACAAFCSACSLSRISASSGSRSCTGWRSNTSRCRYAATGASANSSGATSCFRSMTRRTTRGWFWPTRTPAMYGSSGRAPCRPARAAAG